MALLSLFVYLFISSITAQNTTTSTSTADASTTGASTAAQNSTSNAATTANNAPNKVTTTTAVPCAEKTTCPEKIKVIRWNYPPYTNTYNNKVFAKQGLFEWLVDMLVKECCGECSALEYGIEKYIHEDLNDAVGTAILMNETDLHGGIYFPVYGTMKKIKYQDRQLFPIIESPGVVYMELKGKNDNSATHVLSKLVGGWPVLVLTIIMAAVSGILMWAMDSYYNPEEFPRTFFKGSWEGFWWAFITMTTVGYGDISPRSFFGRIFSFFWILIGLTIISIFTATVTSALTELSLTEEISLYGKKMVVYNYTEEHRYGVKGNAKVHAVRNINDMVKAIKEGVKTDDGNQDFDGGLLDNYVAGHYELDFSTTEYDTPKVFDYSYSYGFLTDGVLEHIGITSCFRRVISEKDDKIQEFIDKNFKVYVAPASATQGEGGFNLFDSKSDVFIVAVVACLGAIFVLMLLAVAWEYFYWIPKQKKLFPPKKEELRVRSPYATYEEMITAQCDELQQVMHEETVSFYKTFHAKIEQVRQERVYREGEDSDDDEEEIGRDLKGEGSSQEIKVDF